MLFGPHEIVSYLSKRFTFEPGDCIAFGSLANPGSRRARRTRRNHLRGRRNAVEPDRRGRVTENAFKNMCGGARLRTPDGARSACEERGERGEREPRGWGGMGCGCGAGWDSKGQSPVALPPAARGAKRLAVTGAMRRLQARALLSPCREDEAHRRKDRRKRATRVTEDRSEVRVLAAGALEEFTVDLQSTTYNKRAAGVQ